MAKTNGLGGNLKALRLARGLSLRQLGAQVGVSASTLSRAERGCFDSVMFSTARKLAAYFNLSIDELLAEQLACMDCGRLYQDFGLDTVLPNDQWAQVSGREDGSGILCAACIVRRAAKLQRFTVARMRLEE